MQKTTFTPSRWVLLSALQKSIRRGKADIALRAANLLEPNMLLKRLRVIAVEDIGVENIPLLHRVMLAQPEDGVSLAAEMCGSVKDRSACDYWTAKGNAPERVTDGVFGLARRLTKEPLCDYLPMIAGMVEDIRWETDTLTEAPLIHGWPTWCFDMFTREGKQAYRRFLTTHPHVRRELERWTDDPLGLLGHAMFVVESEKLDRRLVFPGSVEIHRKGNLADIMKFGVSESVVNDLLELIKFYLLFIHQTRHELLHA